jgi:hypothetical protein
VNGIVISSGMAYARLIVVFRLLEETEQWFQRFCALTRRQDAHGGRNFFLRRILCGAAAAI